MNGASGVRLTSMTSCGGCAAKLGADELHNLVELLTMQPSLPGVLAGLNPPDDAAVYQLDGGHAIVGTVDFFPPIVDDPYTFGAIAAANAVSDVFAMGGHVLFALNIAAFPESLPPNTIRAIFAGGSDIVREAGGMVAGGHTIRDREPKYGLAVIGTADPERLLLKSAARPGDRLMITKPLGTGLVISALRSGLIDEGSTAAAIASMLHLNLNAARVLVEAGVAAATDVTGFGLLGHACEMSTASKVRIHLDADQLPALPGALGLVGRVRTTGAAHNLRFVRAALGHVPVEAARLELALDPQTSGGLLAAVPPRLAGVVESALAAAGDHVWWIGHVEAGNGISLS